MKTIWTLLLIVVATVGNAQTTFYFSTDVTESCLWDSYTEEFSKCEKTYESTVWSMNEDQTVFKHRTETMISTYWVTGYDDELGVEYEDKFGYYIQSDAGNRYYLMVDFGYKCIKVMPMNKYKTADWMLLYQWKNYWKE